MPLSFSLPKQDGIFFKRIFQKMSLFAFFLFMTIGGFSRFIRLPQFSDNISIVEGLLYTITFISAFFFSIRRFETFALFGSFLFLSLSFLWGVLLWGPDTAAFLYMLRFFFLFQSAITLGKIFYDRFGLDIKRLIRFLLYIYGLVAILSLLMFLIFPSSNELWEVLKNVGITFHGDPHKGRLISVYFDPNFYGALILLPLFFSIWLHKEKPSMAHKFLILLFAITCVLTFSRSAFGTFAIMGICYLCKNFHFQKRFYIKKSALLFLVGSLVLIYFTKDSCLYLLDRTIKITSDPSAYFRYESAANSLEWVQKHPILGIGYNFYPLINGASSAPDSSLLATLLYFGTVGTILLIATITKSVKIIFENCKTSTKEISEISFVLKIYFAVSVFFTSFFNNLLYYPYWFLLVVPVLTYLFLSSCNLKGISKQIS